MFKTDKASLEKISFLFNEQDIARFRILIENLRNDNLSSLPSEELNRLAFGLEEIGKLKLNGKVYGFEVYDSFAEREGKGEGVELYLRQGDFLQDFFIPNSRDFVYSTEQTVQFLKKKSISKIYTGNIPYKSDFLGVTAKCDPDDPIIRGILKEADIQEFSLEGIEVVVLDHLI